MFLVGLRTKLATNAVRIETVADLARELCPSCALETNVLGEHADELLLIIKSIISPTQLGADASDLDVQSHAVELSQSHVEHYVEETEATQSRQSETKEPSVARGAREARGARGARRAKEVRRAGTGEEEGLMGLREVRSLPRAATLCGVNQAEEEVGHKVNLKVHEVHNPAHPQLLEVKHMMYLFLEVN